MTQIKIVVICHGNASPKFTTGELCNVFRITDKLGDNMRYTCLTHDCMGIMVPQ
jgi:hypothetical protein